MNKQQRIKETKDAARAAIASILRVPDELAEYLDHASGDTLYAYPDCDYMAVRKIARGLFGQEKLSRYYSGHDNSLAFSYKFQNGKEIVFFASVGKNELLKKLSGGRCSILTEERKREFVSCYSGGGV